jgi:AraC family transcriptional activator of pobA
MQDKDKIYSFELTYDDAPMPFIIKPIEEIDKIFGDICDNPHRHNYYTIIWFLTATGKLVIDFKEYPILPNHIFFIGPRQVHQLITDPKPTGFVIIFTSEFLDKNSIRKDFIANLGLFQKSDETPPLPLTNKMVYTLKPFADKMLSAFQTKNDMFLETCGAYLKLFLIECNGQCSLFPDSHMQTIEMGKTLVNNFKALVEKHYSKWHQVKYYADALNVTPNYLYEVV